MTDQDALSFCCRKIFIFETTTNRRLATSEERHHAIGCYGNAGRHWVLQRQKSPPAPQLAIWRMMAFTLANGMVARPSRTLPPPRPGGSAQVIGDDSPEVRAGGFEPVPRPASSLLSILPYDPSPIPCSHILTSLYPCSRCTSGTRDGNGSGGGSDSGNGCGGTAGAAWQYI